MEKELFPSLSETSIKCEYKDDKSEIIVVPEGDSKLDGLPVIEVQNRWPYVGQSLEISCTFHMKPTYKYSLKWRCPRCEQDTVFIIY